MNLSSLITTLADATKGGVWMPPQASTLSGEVDSLFFFIFWLCVFFFVGIVGATVYFVVKYRRRSAAQRTSGVKGNRRIEILWSVIPSILLLAIFAWGFRTYVKMSVAPGDSINIRVTGQKWFWAFDYPRDGINTDELVVPVGRPVKLTMSSRDVIHSFYVPAFRIKKDVLPNRYTQVWFQAEHTGEFHVFCAEYCGSAHSEMRARVRVVTDQQYQDWIDSGGGLGGEGMSSAEFGALIFEKKGCGKCHTVDGSKLTGPTMKGLFGRTEHFTDGSSQVVDDNYIRESIMEPQKKIVQGYEPVMPTFKGLLKDKQTDALIDYIKSLGEEQK